MSEYFYTKKEAEKAILVGVALQSENISYDMMCEYLDELAFLAETAGANRDKMFAGLRSVVSKECYAEVLGYGNKEVALRRLLGEALYRNGFPSTSNTR